MLFDSLKSVFTFGKIGCRPAVGIEPCNHEVTCSNVAIFELCRLISVS